LQQNDLVRAREYFDQALKIDPNNAAALINLAALCEQEGKKAEATSLYKRVLALPSPEGGDGQNGPAGEDPYKVLAKEGLKRLQLGKGAGG
jgi:general secretion pathway protein D